MKWRRPMKMANWIAILVCLFCALPSLSAEDAERVAPGFYLRDLNGQDFFASRRYGPEAEDPKPYVFSFFATWCIPCRAEAPQLEILSKKVPQVDFYLISVKDSEDQILKWLDQYEIGLDVLVDRYGRTAKKFGVIGSSESGGDIASLPSLFVINSQGIIIYSHTGYSPGDEKELAAILETLK